MNLNSQLAKQLIDNIHSNDTVTFDNLADSLIKKYDSIFSHHKLFIRQDQESYDFSAGLYLEKSGDNYTPETLFSQYTQFSRFSLELKQLLEIIEFLKSKNYITSLVAQPPLTMVNEIIWCKGYENTQTKHHWGIADAPLLNMLYSNYSTSIKKSDKLTKLIKNNYLAEDDYRFIMSMKKANCNLAIATIVGIVSLLTLIYTAKQLTNIDTVSLEKNQIEEIKKSIISEEFISKKLEVFDSLRILKLVDEKLEEIKISEQGQKEQLDIMNKKLNSLKNPTPK